MKKLLFMSLMILFIIGTANAQTPVVVTYTFDGKTLVTPPSLQTLKRGDFYQIEIKNLNQNLYKVSINHTDSIVSKALEMPTFGSFQLDAISTLIGGISPKMTTVVKVKAPDDKTKGWASQPKFITKVVSSPIGQQMKADKIKLDGYLAELRRIKTEIDNIQIETFKYALNELKVTPTSGTGYDYNTTLTKVTTLRNDINIVQSAIMASQKLYLAFSETNKAAIEKDKNYTTTDGEIKNSYSQLLTTCTEAQTAVSADKVKELLTTLVHAENNSVGTFKSLPLQFTKEQATVDILIEPRKPEYMLQAYKTSLTFPIERLSYAAVGVSFYGATLHDEAFSTIGMPVNDSVTHYKIKSEKITKAEVGIAALLRFGTKFKKNDFWGIHGSIGPGISIADKIKPRLLTGIGFSAGTKHMFTFDLGGIFGYVDRLSSAYNNTDEELSVKPENITVSKLSAGGFASVGYLYKF